MVNEIMLPLWKHLAAFCIFINTINRIVQTFTRTLPVKIDRCWQPTICDCSNMLIHSVGHVTFYFGRLRAAWGLLNVSNVFVPQIRLLLRTSRCIPMDVCTNTLFLLVVVFSSYYHRCCRRFTVGIAHSCFARMFAHHKEKVCQHEHDNWERK